MNNCRRDFNFFKALPNHTAILPVIGFLCLLALSITPVSAQQGKPAPQLIVEKTRHDFGEVFAGEDISHAFMIRNNGAVPLELGDRPFLMPRASKVSVRTISADPVLIPSSAIFRVPAPS